MMTADEMIAAIQALRNGKQLQWRYRWRASGAVSEAWIDLEPRPLDFNFTDYEYREKPKEIGMMTIDDMIDVLKALQQGRTVQRRPRFSAEAEWQEWRDAQNVNFTDYEYRIKPEPKRIPLGPEDVPPGSVLTLECGMKGLWHSIVCCCRTGVVVAFNSELKLRSFEELTDLNFTISRDGGKTWSPCWKEEP